MRTAGETPQVVWDAMGCAYALAAAGRDEEAVTVAGIAQALGTELGMGARPLVGGDRLVAAVARLSPALVQTAEARGRDVPARMRIKTVCEISGAVAAVASSGRGAAEAMPESESRSAAR